MFFCVFSQFVTSHILHFRWHYPRACHCTWGEDWPHAYDLL